MGHPLPSTFWSALESVSGGSALLTLWKRQVGNDFDTFASLFLKPRPGEPAQFVPCPWNCGCSHKVVPRGNGTLAGLCQCPTPHCGEYTVVPEERITWELDWSKIARSLCQAFSLQPGAVKLGLHNTLQIGALAPGSAGVPAGEPPSEGGPAAPKLPSEGGACRAEAPSEGGSIPRSQLSTQDSQLLPVPAILTLASSQVELTNIIAVLVARLARSFILFAPTINHLGPAAKELLAHTGSAFFPLSDHLHSSSSSSSSSCSPAGSSSEIQSSMFEVQGSMFHLVSAIAPEALFADLAPLLPDPSDEELARRTFILLQQPDESTRRQKPDLYTVFHLYCVKELTIPQIARKCRCSIGTIANRLKLLHARTGFPPDQLRRIAPQFAQFQQDHNQAERNYRRSRR